MSRNNIEGCRLEEIMLSKGIRAGVHVETKAADWTVDRDQALLAYITLTGAGRNMTLPAAELGLMFYIYNTSATALDITVKNASATTLGVISQNELGLMHSDGTNWYCTMVGANT